MGRSAKKKARGKGKGDGERPKRCHQCSMYVKDATKGKVCPGCQYTFCASCVEGDGTNPPEFIKCGRGGCPFPARCIDCCRGHTHARLEKQNDERERRGEDRIPIPDEAKTLVVCTNNYTTGRTCAGRSRANRYCIACANIVIQESRVKKSRVMAYCPHCHGSFCIPCRDISDLNKVDVCDQCDNCSCRGCTRFKFCPNCDRGYCDHQDCSTANICEPCAGCDRIVCVQCDLEGSDEHGLCGRCYKPCTNPDCPNEELTDTKRCGACRTTRYCGKECQVAMWSEHKEECLLIKKEKDDKRMEAKARRRAAKKEAVAAAAVP